MPNAIPHPADDDRGRDRRHQRPGRAHRLTPRFSTEELAAIQQAAARVGMTATGFCADAALVQAGRVEAMSLDPVREILADFQAELYATRTAVGRIGTNLNQAAAALNATGQAPEWLVTAVVLCERRMERIDAVIALIDRRLR
ncbi:plasmid mobilization protein [Catenuloplanes sp. NPDC051500]|uniref:plasmid mobilization protein n=1 Tax=Catenuloplanes sp. NPDC051500 TaxID=3363959 RepID=UPI0037AC6CCC